LTVFGEEPVTLKVPLVIVNVLAMPSIELLERLNEVALMVTLYKLAVPFKEDVPAKVVVPALAVKLPLTSNEEFTVIFIAVLIEPPGEKL
jgi:hypothetical protein